MKYRISIQDYTTHNDPAVDPGHRDRIDDERELEFESGYKLSKRVSLDAVYRWSRRQSTLPNDPGKTEDDTTWQRNEVTIGITVRL